MINNKIIITINVFTLLFLLSFNTYSQFIRPKYLDSLKNIAKKTDNDIELIKNYTLIANYYSETNRDSAIFYADLAQILADKSENELQKARVLNLKADLYRRHNDFKQSIKLDERALEIAVQLNDSFLMSEIYNDLGVTYRRLDDEAEAVKFHLRALDIARIISDSTNLSKALNGMGIIYFGQGRYDDAEKHYREALIIETKRKNLLGMAINYNTIAEIYQRKGLFEKSLEYYNLSIETNSRNNDSLGIAICYNDLGYTYYLMENYSKAFSFAFKAYNYFKKSKKNRELANSLLNLGNIYLADKKYAGAIKYLKDCEKIATDYEFKSVKHQCYLSLSDTYEKIGYLSFSLKYYKMAYEEYEIINKDQELKISAELEAKYQIKSIKNENELLLEKDKIKDSIILRQRIISIVVSFLVVLLVVGIFLIFMSRKISREQKLIIEKKHLELLERNSEVILQKEKIDEQNDALNIQKNELIAANASKDLFLSIIAHDLRNPFNAFLSLSGILLDEYKTLSDEEKIEMIALINESAGNAYRLLENLLSWAKSQTGAIETKREVFNLSFATEEVFETEKIKIINKDLSFFVEIDSNIEVYADKNMIMTVIRNLVSNAIKFTPRGGLIKLIANRNDSNIEIKIVDNGIGIKEDKLKTIFDLEAGYKRKGTENEKGSGLGLTLCKDFVEKNNGKISAESKAGEGSVFIFTVPFPPKNI